MAFERITLDINANGEMPTFHCKQFDIGRPIIIDLVAGDDDYTPAAGVTFELQCRKVDMNLVVISDYEIDSNEITFASTQQLTACVGDNLATLKMFKDELEIGTMNFFINVAIDPEAQGIVSNTVIDNLTTQIEDITEQVIGDNYYDKEEVDDLLDLKADAADVYTKTQVDSALALKADKATTYTKTETDTLLSDKADKSDTYTKAQVDSALSAKANTADLATVATTGDYDDLINKPSIPAAQVQSDYGQSDDTKVDYIKNKPDINGMINDAILQIMPVGTASGSTATFVTELAGPLVNVSCAVAASGGGGTPASPIPIVGYSQANITANGNTHTIAFGQTVYGGVLDITSGKLHITHNIIDMGSINWNKLVISASVTGYQTATAPTGIKPNKDNNTVPDILCEVFEPDTVNHGYNGETAECITENTIGLVTVYTQTPYADGSAFKTAMTGMEFTYLLATPFDIDLTPVQISAIVGENNVYTDTNGNTTVQYKDSIQHYIDTRS